jgi:hypothetical protein
MGSSVDTSRLMSILLALLFQTCCKRRTPARLETVKPNATKATRSVLCACAEDPEVDRCRVSRQ